MNNKALVIFASSAPNGNTAQLLKLLDNLIELEHIYLKDYKITAFDYEHKNKDDDFFIIIKRMLAYDKIIFACPVYWYTMPAQMKVFFDRFSDVLAIEKDLGRQLRGKTAYILSTGYSEKPERSFEEVFLNSFKYLGINYGRMLYSACPNGFVEADNLAKIQEFSNEITA